MEIKNNWELVQALLTLLIALLAIAGSFFWVLGRNELPPTWLMVIMAISAVSSILIEKGGED